LDLQKREDLVRLISKLVSTLSEKEINLLFNEILEKKEHGIPISVFKAPLSSLEVIVKYLKENQRKPIKEISSILNRKVSTIYNTYAKVKQKFPSDLDLSDSSILIPLNIFTNRQYSILESIVFYLIDKKSLSISDISKLLNKSQSTIRTVQRRYKIKINAKN
tara:strand:- start:9985 stop:10473 length:489 start_codon:yes stop_codon:yes gene_type:complete